MSDEAELLRRYAAAREESAFAAVVTRFLPLVYAAALRRLAGDTHRAQDVAQQVFAVVARDAAALARHPDFTGWLFTTTRFLAAKAVRGENRRRAREQAAVRHEVLMTADEPPGDTAPLQAVLDEALMELGRDERQIVLLRFHRGLRLADIGAQLGASENAVQKRLARALEQLRLALGRRGVTSTAAALAVACEQHAVVAIPAGLAAAVTRAGLAGAAASGGLGWFATWFVGKAQVGVGLAVLAAGGAGLAGMAQANARLRAETQAEDAAFAARMQELAERRDAHLARAAAAEEDGRALQQALAAANRTAAAPARSRVLSDAQERTQAALTQAFRLQRDGKLQEALEVCLQAYRGLTGAQRMVQLQQVASALRRLGEAHPPARVALRDLRDAAMKTVQTGAATREQLMEVAFLNDRLEEPEATIALYDALPRDHDGRQGLAVLVFAALVEQRRYADAIVGKSPGHMVREFEMKLRMLTPEAANGAGDFRSQVIAETARQIEALAGVGLDHDARVLSEKLFAFDDSAETRQRVQAHLERARRGAAPTRP